MARPEKYTDEDYLAWIESQVLSGRSVSDIKPTELQRSIGGKYSRCQEVLTLAQDRLSDQIDATIPSMPVWFRNFISQLVEQTQNIAENQWPPVGRGINEAIQDATTVFENQKAEIDSQLLEHLEQIRTLEAVDEDNVARIEDLQRQLTDAINELSTLRSKNAALEAELAAFKDQQANIAQLMSDQKSALKTDLDKLSASLQSKVDQNTKLREQIVEARADARSAQKDLSSMQADASRCEALLREKGLELIEACSERDKLIGQLEQSQKQLQGSKRA